MTLVDLQYIEAIAIMSRYNPFFEKAGMCKIMERFPDHETTEAIEDLHMHACNANVSLGATQILITTFDKSVITLSGITAR